MEKERNGPESNNRSHHGAIVLALQPQPDRVYNIPLSGFFLLVNIEVCDLSACYESDNDFSYVGLTIHVCAGGSCSIDKETTIPRLLCPCVYQGVL